MADPLSVAGLGIGVVALGLQVARGITTYIDALNCRDKDIASVAEASLSKFQCDHQVATSAVHAGLDSCQKELNALENLVTDLTAYDQSAASKKHEFKSQGKNLLCPFSRPKIEQLETRIRKANATLQLALQALGLFVSQLSTEKLAMLEATSYNISASLLGLRSKISAMDSPLQDMQSTLSRFGTRLDTLQILVAQLLVSQPDENGMLQGFPYLLSSYDLKVLEAKWEQSLEDASEDEGEHAYELALLEELLGEFEEEFIAILQDPIRKIDDLIAFWEHIWVSRMQEVIDRLQGSDLGDDERRRAEEIGVVWDQPQAQPPKVPGNPYKGDTIDHWMYELERIETESFL
ncbi:hypothetical protein MMYC01_204985 [Madurella mycetomatis]|uniref:Fungal N-terminal domain-containing protein n=1 Tax=Madurella mycetomatis TaxID=100816 RepID=A0A175W9C2_9PEZI|nr:hypothetical protein MMYC01_204985 [Madurella mycetomatis]